MRWNALFVVLSICPLAAFAKTPKLFCVPVQYTSDSGYVFGAAGTFQYDYNGFSDGGFDPATGAPLFKSASGWSHSEIDPYFETPNGLKVQFGYNWNKSWNQLHPVQLEPDRRFPPRPVPDTRRLAAAGRRTELHVPDAQPAGPRHSGEFPHRRALELRADSGLVLPTGVFLAR